MLIEALNYLKRGWSVFPVPLGSKVPIIEWKEFQNRYATKEEVQTWFGDKKNNIGLATGKISNLVVADFDGESGRQTKNNLGIVSPQAARSGRSDGGEHSYFSWPNCEVRNSQNKEKGYDIRGEGGYVIAPPSIHESGMRYRWIKEFNGKLPTFPVEKFVNQGCAFSFPTKPQGWVVDALAGMREGNRRITLLKVGGRLRFKGLSEAEIAAMLEPYASKHGLEASQFNRIMKDVFKYPPRLEASRSTSLQLHTYEDSIEDYMNKGQEKADFFTGFPKLDEITGGLKKKDIFTVAARTGVGKTNFLVTVSRHLCSQGYRVLYFSTEMPYEQIWKRYGVDLVKQHQFVVSDIGSPKLYHIKDAIQASQPDVLVFDHINFIGDTNEELSKFIKGVKLLILDADIPLLLAAQLNREADWVDPQTKEHTPPRISQIKGCGAIEEVGGQILLLYKVSAGLVGGSVDKNRHGSEGFTSFELSVSPQLGFKELA